MELECLGWFDKPDVYSSSNSCAGHSPGQNSDAGKEEESCVEESSLQHLSYYRDNHSHGDEGSCGENDYTNHDLYNGDNADKNCADEGDRECNGAGEDGDDNDDEEEEDEDDDDIDEDDEDEDDTDDEEEEEEEEEEEGAGKDENDHDFYDTDSDNHEKYTNVLQVEIEDSIDYCSSVSRWCSRNEAEKYSNTRFSASGAFEVNNSLARKDEQSNKQDQDKQSNSSKGVQNNSQSIYYSRNKFKHVYYINTEEDNKENCDSRNDLQRDDHVEESEIEDQAPCRSSSKRRCDQESTTGQESSYIYCKTCLRNNKSRSDQETEETIKHFFKGNHDYGDPKDDCYFSNDKWEDPLKPWFEVGLDDDYNQCRVQIPVISDTESAETSQEKICYWDDAVWKDADRKWFESSLDEPLEICGEKEGGTAEDMLGVGAGLERETRKRENEKRKNDEAKETGDYNDRKKRASDKMEEGDDKKTEQYNKAEKKGRRSEVMDRGECDRGKDRKGEEAKEKSNNGFYHYTIEDITSLPSGEIRSTSQLAIARARANKTIITGGKDSSMKIYYKPKKGTGENETKSSEIAPCEHRRQNDFEPKIINETEFSARTKSSLSSECTCDHADPVDDIQSKTQSEQKMLEDKIKRATIMTIFSGHFRRKGNRTMTLSGVSRRPVDLVRKTVDSEKSISEALQDRDSAEIKRWFREDLGANARDSHSCGPGSLSIDFEIMKANTSFLYPLHSSSSLEMQRKDQNKSIISSVYDKGDRETENESQERLPLLYVIHPDKCKRQPVVTSVSDAPSEHRERRHEEGQGQCTSEAILNLDNTLDKESHSPTSKALSNLDKNMVDKESHSPTSKTLLNLDKNMLETENHSPTSKTLLNLDKNMLDTENHSPTSKALFNLDKNMLDTERHSPTSNTLLNLDKNILDTKSQSSKSKTAVDTENQSSTSESILNLDKNTLGKESLSPSVYHTTTGHSEAQVSLMNTSKEARLMHSIQDHDSEDHSIMEPDKSDCSTCESIEDTKTQVNGKRNRLLPMANNKINDTNSDKLIEGRNDKRKKQVFLDEKNILSKGSAASPDLEQSVLGQDVPGNPGGLQKCPRSVNGDLPLENEQDECAAVRREMNEDVVMERDVHNRSARVGLCENMASGKEEILNLENGVRNEEGKALHDFVSTKLKSLHGGINQDEPMFCSPLSDDVPSKNEVTQALNDKDVTEVMSRMKIDGLKFNEPAPKFASGLLKNAGDAVGYSFKNTAEKNIEMFQQEQQQLMKEKRARNTQADKHEPGIIRKQFLKRSDSLKEFGSSWSLGSKFADFKLLRTPTLKENNKPSAYLEQSEKHELKTESEMAKTVSKKTFISSFPTEGKDNDRQLKDVESHREEVKNRQHFSKSSIESQYYSDTARQNCNFQPQNGSETKEKSNTLALSHSNPTKQRIPPVQQASISKSETQNGAHSLQEQPQQPLQDPKGPNPAQDNLSSYSSFVHSTKRDRKYPKRYVVRQMKSVTNNSATEGEQAEASKSSRSFMDHLTSSFVNSTSAKKSHPWYSWFLYLNESRSNDGQMSQAEMLEKARAKKCQLLQTQDGAGENVNNSFTCGEHLTVQRRTQPEVRREDRGQKPDNLSYIIKRREHEKSLGYKGDSTTNSLNIYQQQELPVKQSPSLTTVAKLENTRDLIYSREGLGMASAGHINRGKICQTVTQEKSNQDAVFFFLEDSWNKKYPKRTHRRIESPSPSQTEQSLRTSYTEENAMSIASPELLSSQYRENTNTNADSLHLEKKKRKKEKKAKKLKKEEEDKALAEKLLRIEKELAKEQRKQKLREKLREKAKKTTFMASEKSQEEKERELTFSKKLRRVRKSLRGAVQEGVCLSDSINTLLAWNIIQLLVAFLLLLSTCCPGPLHRNLPCPLPSVCDKFYHGLLVPFGLDTTVLGKALKPHRQTYWPTLKNPFAKKPKVGSFYPFAYKIVKMPVRAAQAVYSSFLVPLPTQLPVLVDTIVSVLKYVVSLPCTLIGQGSERLTKVPVKNEQQEKEEEKEELQLEEEDNTPDKLVKSGMTPDAHLNTLLKSGSFFFYMGFDTPPEGCDFSYFKGAWLYFTGNYPKKCL